MMKFTNNNTTMAITEQLKKYELTGETITVNGHTLHRIKALRSFNDVKAGDLGGFVESERNLSHEGNCWVYSTAKVYGDAEIFGHARIYDNAEIFDNAKIYGHAFVYDNAKVYGHVEAYENAIIYENAKVYRDAVVCGSDIVGNDSSFQ